MLLKSIFNRLITDTASEVLHMIWFYSLFQLLVLLLFRAHFSVLIFVCVKKLFIGRMKHGEYDTAKYIQFKSNLRCIISVFYTKPRRKFCKFKSNRYECANFILISNFDLICIQEFGHHPLGLTFESHLSRIYSCKFSHFPFIFSLVRYLFICRFH